jgi:hypothetical protein
LEPSDSRRGIGFAAVSALANWSFFGCPSHGHNIPQIVITRSSRLQVYVYMRC